MQKKEEAKKPHKDRKEAIISLKIHPMERKDGQNKKIGSPDAWKSLESPKIQRLNTFEQNNFGCSPKLENFESNNFGHLKKSEWSTKRRRLRKIKSSPLGCLTMRLTSPWQVMQRQNFRWNRARTPDILHSRGQLLYFVILI